MISFKKVHIHHNLQKLLDALKNFTQSIQQTDSNQSKLLEDETEKQYLVGAGVGLIDFGENPGRGKV